MRARALQTLNAVTQSKTHDLLGLVWYYAESNPTMSQWGRRTLGRLVRGSDQLELAAD